MSKINESYQSSNRMNESVDSATPMMSDSINDSNHQRTFRQTSTDPRSPGGGSVSVPLDVSRRAYNLEKFDRHFGYVEAESDADRLRARLRRECECSRSRLWRMLVGFLPIIGWLPRYRIKEDLIPDMIAGITVGIMHIPQGMAYAGLAGLDPVYGLYTSFFPSLFYMFFGTSRHVSLGVFAVVSLMVGQVRLSILPDEIVEQRENHTLTDHSDPVYALTPIEVVTCLTMAVGLIQLLMGFLRLGFITAYLSDQVVSGFTTGAAVHVFTAQINKVLNVKLPRPPGGPGALYRIYRALVKAAPEASWLTVTVSFITMVILVLGKELVNPPVKKRFHVPIPWELIVVIVGTVVSHSFNFNAEFDMEIVNTIPTGLPIPRLPPMWLLPRLLTDAIGIAIVVFVITISLGKLFAKKHHYRIDPDQELLALGAMQSLSCFFDVYPASTALARSLVYEAAGVRTQISTVFTCALLFVVLMWLGPLFKHLPMCVLASIIIVALKGMFMQLKQLPNLWAVSKLDFAIWIVAFAATVGLDVREGLLVGICFALFTSILRSQRPPAIVLGRLPNTEIYRDVKRYKSIEMMPGICVFRFDSPLMFTNTETFRDKLYIKCGIDLAKARQMVADEQKKLAQKERGIVESLPSPDQNDTHTTENANASQPLRSPTTTATVNGLNTSAASISTPKQLEGGDAINLPDFVVLDCSGFNYVDYMAVQTLIAIFDEMAEIGVTLLYAQLKGGARDVMEHGGFFEKVPKSSCFPTVHCAVTYAQSKRLKRRRASSGDSVFLDANDVFV